MLKRSRATSNVYDGIFISGSAKVTESVSSDNGASGMEIFPFGFDVLVDDNTANRNGWRTTDGSAGIWVDGAASGRNTAKGNRGTPCSPTNIC